MEVPFAVVFLPGVVDHYDSRGQAVGKDAAGVIEHALLVLVVHQLDPGIVLRLAVEFFGRKLPGGGKMCGGSGPVGIGQIVARLDHLNVPFYQERLALHAERKRLLAPHVAAVRQQQQRGYLIGAVIRQIGGKT